MRLFFSAAALILTVQTASALSRYTLSIDGVDDHLTCTLNGKQVAKLNFGQTGNFPLSPQSGNNKLVCTPKDDNAPSSPCWAYAFRLTQDNAELDKLQSTCCASSCNLPDPVTIDFNVQ